MKTNKIVYIVNGSEDGVLGVYGNVKGAYKTATDYVLNGCGDTIELNKKSYSKVCKELKRYFSSNVANDDICSASIDCYYFNQ